jgi:DNA-binding NarL/FixJ family response regulator
MMKEHILIVEDDELQRRLLATYLKEKGFQVSQASTVTELRQQIQKPHSLAAILLDIGLPDGSGLDEVAMLRSNTQSGIVVISRDEDEAIRIKALELGADDYIVKPYPARELLARLTGLLSRLAPQQATYQLNAYSDLIERYKLSPTELAVVSLLAEGLKRKEIAAKLDILLNTTINHIKHIYKKLGVNSRLEAARIFSTVIASDPTVTHQQLEDAPIPAEEHAFIQRMREQVTDNVAMAGFGVEDLASAMNMSSATLRRRLAAHANFSPSEFIRQCRLEKARQLLVKGETKTLAELAYKVGFNHPHYFARLYKKAFNEWPQPG